MSHAVSLEPAAAAVARGIVLAYRGPNSGGDVRLVRDPIHGDVPLSLVASAVVDHVAFQRLRYIRQNGLLHFVFPGAVHTRFAHSIGTMHNAQRLGEVLFAPIRAHAKSDAERTSIAHVHECFALSGLLHDIGHCAFSHSIETIERSPSKPLLGTVRELAASWGELPLCNAREEFLRNSADENADHEAIGCFLIQKIFQSASVSDATKTLLGTTGSDIAADICAIQIGRAHV